MPKNYQTEHEYDDHFAYDPKINSNHIIMPNEKKYAEDKKTLDLKLKEWKEIENKIQYDSIDIDLNRPPIIK
jgi:hypothetical protein